jgi:hypothetical protein
MILMMIMMIMSIGWDYVSELLPPTGLLFISQVILSMENHDEMISAGENSWFVYHNSLEIVLDI